MRNFMDTVDIYIGLWCSLTFGGSDRINWHIYCYKESKCAKDNCDI